jgi:hypothetical protein
VRVDSALFCRAGTIHDGVADIEGAGIDTWAVTEFPTHVDATVFVRFVGPWKPEPSELVVSFVDAGESLLAETRFPLQLGDRPLFLPEGWDTYGMTLVQLDLGIAAPGNFMIFLAAEDDLEPKRLPLFVRPR